MDGRKNNKIITTANSGNFTNNNQKTTKMGQEICAIIIEKNIHIDENIVHFVEDNFTVIPINLDLSFFIDNIGDFISIIDYCTFLKTTNEYINEIIENEYNEEGYHTIKTLVEIIETYELNNFIIEYYREWADMIDDNLCIAVINGEIKKQSIFKMWVDGNKENINIEEFYKLIGAERNWIANESRYFDYRAAKFAYYKK